MRIDAIVVPRGAEARAVRQGWALAQQTFVTVPAGDAAGRSVVSGAAMETVLVLGLCGALDPALRVGDAVVYGEIADDAHGALSLDAELTRRCAAALDRAPVRAANASSVVGDRAAKAALAAATGAAVLDMEAAGLARAFAGRGIRVAMVRVVSDDAHHDLPDLRNVYTPHGDLRALVLAGALVRRPRSGARFIRDALRALTALERTAARISAA